VAQTSQLAKTGNGKDGKRMILIPAGEFLMGTSAADAIEMEKGYGWRPKWFADEMPQHRVTLDAYYIDETPVTNAEYKHFLDANPEHPAPSDWDQSQRNCSLGKDDHPVVFVSWSDADAYARWARKRLPTEAEWEKAARGTEGRRFPWGQEFDHRCCNTSSSGLRSTTAVRQYMEIGDSPYGVIDMAGNVWEWCADWYDAEYYKRSFTYNPLGPDADDWRVLRGGAWDITPDYTRCASRDYIVPDQGYGTVGFRCVMAVR
jgi:formylglycine-generating enzyme required for sulfatase activity